MWKPKQRWRLRRKARSAKQWWKTTWFCCRAKHAAHEAAAHLGKNLCDGIPRESEAIRVPGSRGHIAADGTVADEADLTGAAAVAVETAGEADSTGAAEAVEHRIADTMAGTHHNGVHN
jgi:hypothetical protein